MRVLQIAAKIFSLANFALPLMARLRDEGFEVEALGQFDGSEERIRAAGFSAHPWNMGHSFNPLTILRARRELASLLTQEPYDIVHTHCSFGGIVANRVARPLTGRLLYTQHGFYVHEGLSPLMRRAWLQIEKSGLRWAHRVICISRAERDLALTLGVGDPDKFTTIPGAGVDLCRFALPDHEREARREKIRQELGIGPGETVLLTVSRLTWDKGYREMIQAARALRRGGQKFRFLAAGSGKDEAQIRQAIDQAGLGDCFALLGWREDAPDLYCAADVFVFASYREGLPIAPIEAMASGLPVVAGAIPGCVEEIDHEQEGLLFPARDAGALVDALRRVMGDPDLARSMGEAGRVKAREFELSRVLDLQAQLYRDIESAP